MTLDNKLLEKLGRDELMSLVMVLRDINDIIDDTLVDNLVAVKLQQGHQVSGTKQPYYYAVREQVNETKTDILDYLLTQGAIENYEMLQLNPEKLDYKIAVDSKKFIPYYKRAINLSKPYVARLNGERSYTPQKSEAIKVTLDFNGFSSPIVHTPNESVTVRTMRSGKSFDIVWQCVQHANEPISLEDMKNLLKASGTTSYQGLDNLTDALRKSLYESGEGPLSVFVTVSPKVIMIKTEAYISESELLRIKQFRK